MLISGIGFVGYFLIKYFGAKGGIPLTGFLGALISSTAVTTSMSAQSKKTKLTGIFVVGILIAMATMHTRVLLEIILLGTPQMIATFSIVLISMTIAGIAAAFFFYKKTIQKHTFFWSTKPEIKLDSPFELKPALQFGMIFVVVLFALALGRMYMGESGVYMAAFLSGIIDIDALVLPTLEHVKNDIISFEVGKNAIAIAIFMNTIIKIGYVAILGSKKLTSKITVSVLFVSIVGAIAWFFVS